MTAIDSFPGFGSLQWSCDSGLLQADKNASQLCRVPEQGIVTADIFCRHVHADDHDAVNAALAALLLQGEECDIEYRVLSEHRKNYWLRLQGKCHQVDGQRRITAVVQDISEHKHAERLLEEISQGLAGMTGDAFFSAFVRHLALGLDVNYVLLHEVMLDQPSRLRTVAGFAASGYEYNEACDLDGTPYALVLQEGVWVCQSGLRDHFPEFSVFSDENVDGFIGVVLRDADDRALGLLSVVNKEPLRNVTEALLVIRIFANRALSEMLRSDLEKQRQEMQLQLQQAHKMEAIGMLAGGIAHDFNNILSAVMGYSGLALRNYATDEESKLAQYLKEIYQAGERARDLISQLMLFSRATPGDPQPMVVTPLVKESIKLVRATLPASIDIRQEYAADLPRVMLDPVSLNQLLTNLSVNARDSMAGQGILTVSLAEYARQGAVCSSCHLEVLGDYVDMTVSNTGPGLDELDIRRMFDPFYSTKDIGSGRGLGLSVVHGVLHKLGGHIIVDDLPGRGVSFHLLLPVASDDEEVAIDDASHGPSGAVTKRASIMIVDDEKSITRYLGDFLETRGYRVKLFNVPHEAQQWFVENSDKVDLIITDQTMPGMTGVQLIRSVKKHNAMVPVILCSGYDEVISDLDEIAPGQCLIKPVTIDVLLQAIQNLLAKTKSQVPSPKS